MVGRCVDLLFGWNIGVSKRIFGGRRGYSVGKVSRALKKPPESLVSLGYRVGVV